ncbi:MAG: 16S rRNA (adenine(1518)-N(6)/adenine(1519)-N(6))-dimethyltransferase RsmA [Fusobacterium sp.]|uniref:16S rRNA (adenine(1518)-N(6)/adenine(1519)-N(6))- dimethyltransferase RsmA n=1 Tax=Fusobacterium sp. TaxID=68766 RepID=UPI0026DA7D01|nr:16S rRNA (adenine(1518)-N(6)/adenine(1519)-N(6))-dimethyltransferase RsmA [Fusobacterium sp.]MDO4689977.1 16S rRNA (adenine(1518)-N(6)/adenine(1519)-N(6))-dimethyltransferase RsmA [Fusobacterium sp.]
MSFYHKKKYGQNFLNNELEILNKIIEVSEVGNEDSILEIGPGQGALSSMLVDRVKNLICVEIDRDLEKPLQKKFSNKKNFKLIMADILELDLREYLTKNTKVVANIPYYITSPIINKIIEHRDLIDEAYLMVQKEVGERICAKKGRERSILTLAVEYYGEASYLFTIPRRHFKPIPNVDSAFIKIKLDRENKYKKIMNEAVFFKYIKAAFSNKRKNIVNNLSTLGFKKDFIKEVLKGLNIPESERAENIGIDDFIELIKAFEIKKN